MVLLRALGLTEYVPTWRAMQAFTAARSSDTPDEIWLTEHPPVYTLAAGGEAKIAALGLRVSKGCTYHGLAVNIAMDLSPFADIDPCGYRGLAVTQLADLQVAMTVEAAGAALAPILTAHLARRD